jgi:hypothetical protein
MRTRRHSPHRSQWEFADELSASIPGGDSLVIETYTSMVETLCASLERHVHSMSDLRASAVTDDDRFFTVNQDACRQIREQLIEARRRVAKCTDLLKRFGDRYKLACVFDLITSQTELLDALGV